MEDVGTPPRSTSAAPEPEEAKKSPASAEVAESESKSLKNDLAIKENFERQLAAAAVAYAAAAGSTAAAGNLRPNSSFLIEDILLPKSKVSKYQN